MRCQILCQSLGVIPSQFRPGPLVRLSGRLVLLLLAALFAASLPIADAAHSRTITANGTLKPIARVTLGSQVSGIIREVTCDADSLVKKGQVCARIDPRPFEQAVEIGRANLAAAIAQLQQHTAALVFSKANYERNTNLVERGIVSRSIFEGFRSTYEQAQAQVNFDKALIEQRKAELVVAELNLGYSEIVSPIDGVVLERLITAGETVAADLRVPEMFIISSELSRMQLVARVRESDVGGIKIDNRASFTVKAFPNRQFVGKIDRVGNSPMVMGDDVTYEIIVAIENNDLSLRPGMTAVLTLDAAGSRHPAAHGSVEPNTKA